MHIVKMQNTGHTKTLSVPVSLRREMNLVRNDYFVVVAKTRHIIQYTRLNTNSIAELKKQIQNEKARNGNGR